MHLNLVLRFLRYLPPGVTEIYFHPAIPEGDPSSGNGDPGREYETLTSPQLRQVLLSSGIQQITFSDLGK